LFATGDNVQFFSQLPQEKLQNRVVFEFIPSNFDIKSGFAYDLTFQLLIKNSSLSPFLVELIILDDTSLSITSEFNRNFFTVVSGFQEVVLVAVKVLNGDSGREVLSIGNNPVANTTPVIPAEAVINLDPSALTTILYQITGAATYTFSRGSSVSVMFTTVNGAGNPESWGINDIGFLSRHGLRLSQAGLLSTDSVVTGSTGSEFVMFFVEQTLPSGGKSYASKIIEIIIT
jgi:hypothetical protein